MQLFEHPGQCHVQHTKDIPELSRILRPDSSIFRSQPEGFRLRCFPGGILSEANGLLARHSVFQSFGRPVSERGAVCRQLPGPGHGLAAGMIEQTQAAISEELVRGLSAHRSLPDDRQGQ